jgi:hypothetical protein
MGTKQDDDARAAGTRKPTEKTFPAAHGRRRCYPTAVGGRPAEGRTAAANHVSENGE